MNTLDASATGNLLTDLMLIIFISAGTIGSLIAGAYILMIMYKHRNRERVSLDSVLLQICLPRDNEVKIDAAEQLFASLYSMRKSDITSSLAMQPHISFEIVGRPGDIRFFVHIPNRYRDLVEKQINGAYPDAEIMVVDDEDAKQQGVIGNEYNIFSDIGKVAFTTLKLKSQSYFPLKIYKDMPTDGLSLITSVLAKMSDDEGAAIQIMISPASRSWKNQGRSYLSKLKKDEATPEKANYSSDSKEIEGIENKLTKPGFETTIRVVVSSSTLEAAKGHLDNILSAFGQFAGSNYFKKKHHFFKNLFVKDFIYRYWPLFGSSGVLSAEELATIFHFPNKMITTPNIFWLRAKHAPAPANISQSGLYLGKSLYRGQSRAVYMDPDDRRRHMYIIGRTGTGKSELLKDMILQDIRNGEGVAVIDPHGDLVDDILPRIPPERAEDVILFDPSDSERPMGLNIMEAHTEEQKHFIVASIIGLFYKLYDPNNTGIMGPRLEHSIRNAMLTVMSVPGSTFIEVQRALTDNAFVQEILPKVEDPIVRRYWTDQMAQTSEFHKSETLDYIVSKFSRFTTNKLIRNIIGQSKSSFDVREVMDNKKILLVNLSKGKLGEENSKFLGLLLVPKILTAAMSRANAPMDQRKDFYLYVDEFQNFATPDFAEILSEARKYRLNLTVANQFIGQMQEDVKMAVFGNAGTIMALRTGVTDANFLQHEFAPTFGESDLINIDKFNAYVKTIVHGEPVPAFSLDLTRDMNKLKAEENPRVAELIKELSRLKYGKDAKQVEAEISLRARL